MQNILPGVQVQGENSWYIKDDYLGQTFTQEIDVRFSLFTKNDEGHGVIGEERNWKGSGYYAGQSGYFSVTPKNDFGGLFGIASIGGVEYYTFDGNVHVEHTCAQVESDNEAQYLNPESTYNLNAIGIWSGKAVSISNFAGGKIEAFLRSKENEPMGVTPEPLVVAGILSNYEPEDQSGYVKAVSIPMFGVNAEINAGLADVDMMTTGYIYGIAATGKRNQISLRMMNGDINLSLENVTLECGSDTPVEMAGIAATDRVQIANMGVDASINITIDNIFSAYEPSMGFDLTPDENYYDLNITAYGILVDKDLNKYDYSLDEEYEEDEEDEENLALDKQKIQADAGLNITLNGVINLTNIFPEQIPQGFSDEWATYEYSPYHISTVGYGLYSTKGTYAVINNSISVVGFNDFYKNNYYEEVRTQNYFAYDTCVAIYSQGGPGSWITLSENRIDGDILLGGNNTWLTMNCATVNGGIMTEYLEVTNGISVINCEQKETHNDSLQGTHNYVFTGFDTDVEFTTSTPSLLTINGVAPDETAVIYVSDTFTEDLKTYCAEHDAPLPMANTEFFGILSGDGPGGVGRYAKQGNTETFEDNVYFLYDEEKHAFLSPDSNVVLDRDGLSQESYKDPDKTYVQIQLNDEDQEYWHAVVHEFEDGEVYFIQKNGFYGITFGTSTTPEPPVAPDNEPPYLVNFQQIGECVTLTYEDDFTPSEDIYIWYELSNDEQYSQNWTFYTGTFNASPNYKYVWSYALDAEEGGQGSYPVRCELDWEAPTFGGIEVNGNFVSLFYEDNVSDSEHIKIWYTVWDNDGQLSDDWIEYNGEFEAPDGAVAIMSYAEDEAGNQSEPILTNLDWNEEDDIDVEDIQQVGAFISIDGDFDTKLIFTSFNAENQFGTNPQEFLLTQQDEDFMTQEDSEIYVTAEFCQNVKDYISVYHEYVPMANMAFKGLNNHIGSYSATDGFAQDTYFVIDDTAQICSESPDVVVTVEAFTYDQMMADDRAYVESDDGWHRVVYLFDDGEVYFIQKQGWTDEYQIHPKNGLYATYFGAEIVDKPPYLVKYTQVGDAISLLYDDDHTPVDELKIYYQINGDGKTDSEGWIEYNGAFNITSNDSHFYTYAIDSEGKCSAIEKVDLTQNDGDTTPPVFFEPEQDDDKLKLTYMDDVTLQDNIHIRFRFNGQGAWQDYNGSITLTSNVVSIEHYGIDEAGNESEVTSTQVEKYDTTPPTFVTDKRKSDKVTLLYSDDYSAPENIQIKYRINGQGAWLDYNGYVTVTPNDQFIEHKAIDEAGNESYSETTVIDWSDEEAPIFVSCQYSDDVLFVNYLDDQTLPENLKIYYQLGTNGQVMTEELEYSPNGLLLSPEYTSLWIWAIDEAGNQSEETNITLDAKAPCYKGFALDGDEMELFYQDDVTPAADLVVFYQIDGEYPDGWIAGNGVVDISNATQYVASYAVDAAGRSSDIVHTAIDGNQMPPQGGIPASYGASCSVTWYNADGPDTPEQQAYKVSISTAATSGTPSATLNYTTSVTGVTVFAPATSAWSMTVRNADENSSNETLIEHDLTATYSTEQGAPVILRATDDGNDHLFIATSSGVWEDVYSAKHMGMLESDEDPAIAATGMVCEIEGAQQYCDLFKGAGDTANVIFLSDEKDGLFIDDIYSASPSDLGTTQARLANITEIFAGAGDDVIDMTSSRFRYIGNGMKLHGGAGNDVIWSNLGCNTLYGDDGNDILVGGAWNDTLAGGAGNDILYGNGGDDLFAFCADFGQDEVHQVAGGSITLWFKEGDLSNWNAEGKCYSDGTNKVAVICDESVDITLKFGAGSDVEVFGLMSEDKLFEKNSSLAIY